MNQAEIDHIVPRSKGGSNHNSNLRVVSKKRKFVKTKEARKIVKVRKHQLQRKRATKRRQDINLQRKQKKKK